MLTTFYDFLIRHFKKNVKSHVFLKSEKNIKYVFSNTASNCIFKFCRYSNRPWLEYSKESDAAFCFACRVYGRAAVKDQAPAFVTTGYSNWKTALESGSGFLQHAVAKVHLDAMESWVEHDSRILTDKTVGQRLNSEQLERNRYYVKGVAEVVQFLAVNELGFRGDTATPNCDLEEDTCDVLNVNGMFGHLFEFAMKIRTFMWLQMQRLTMQNIHRQIFRMKLFRFWQVWSRRKLLQIAWSQTLDCSV